jgi:hypothetical protein
VAEIVMIKVELNIRKLGSKIDAIAAILDKYIRHASNRRLIRELVIRGILVLDCLSELVVSG